jgi:hypothetical protein
MLQKDFCERLSYPKLGGRIVLRQLLRCPWQSMFGR